MIIFTDFYICYILYIILYFSDLHLSLKDGVIFTDLHIKPTNGHRFLHYKSSHPSHIKNSITFSQTLRISTLCSSQNDFNPHISNLKDWFLVRHYPQKVASEQIDKVVFGKNQFMKILLSRVCFLLQHIIPKLRT